MTNSKILNNEEGSIIVMALIILSIVTIIGISSSTTSTIELQIVRNERIHQLNFYMAEGAVFEAAERLTLLDGILDYDDLVPATSTLTWMNDQAASVFKTPGNWTNPAFKVSQSLIGTANECRYAVDYIKKQSGSSLKPGALSVNLYAVYGMSQHNSGEVLIEIGSKKPVLNP